jgi:hypothetical protein
VHVEDHGARRGRGALPRAEGRGVGFAGVHVEVELRMGRGGGGGGGGGGVRGGLEGARARGRVASPRRTGTSSARGASDGGGRPRGGGAERRTHRFWRVASARSVGSSATRASMTTSAHFTNHSATIWRARSPMAGAPAYPRAAIFRANRSQNGHEAGGGGRPSADAGLRVRPGPRRRPRGGLRFLRAGVRAARAPRGTLRERARAASSPLEVGGRARASVARDPIAACPTTL